MKNLILAHFWRGLAMWPILPRQVRLAFLKKAIHYTLEYIAWRYYR